MYYRMMEAKLEAERQGDQIEFQQQPDKTWTAEVHTQARVGV